MTFVYFIANERCRAIKIGIAEDVTRRLSSLQTGSCDPLTVLLTVPGDRNDEARLHDRFADIHLSGEWFYAAPVLVGFIDALASARPEEARALLEEQRPTFPLETESELEEDREAGRVFCAMGISALVEFGIERFANEYTDRRGRRTSMFTVRGVIDGKFSLPLDWVLWLAPHSDEVSDALGFIRDRSQRFRDDATGDLARLKLELRRELGATANKLIRKAEAP